MINVLQKRSALATAVLFLSCLIILAGLLYSIPQEKENEKEQVSEQKEPTPEQKEVVPEQDPGPVVSYLIEAQLLPESGKLEATETMSWRNTTSHTQDHLRFHLYYNAFRNQNTSFMREAKLYRKSKRKREKMRFGEIKIKEIKRINGGDLFGKMRYVSPDDGNENDRTVMDLQLEKPVEPGETIRLKFEFVLTIPQIFARTGQEGDYFFIAQWFPKIGVLQADGQWHCHQFHHTSEFFADYGDYRVALTIPQKYIVAATGNRVKTEKNADTTYTYFYEEKNIHDFAWTAYPHFTVVKDKIKLKGNAHETDIELLLAPGHGKFKHRHLESLKFAMEFYARHIYPYPYKKITLVDPPLKGMRSGGMEYPTLITTISVGMLPASFKIPEMVTIHEFGHEYWYGIIGTDEFREAWLDEGVNTFVEMDILEEYFKDSASALTFWIFKISNPDMHRIRYTTLSDVDPTRQYSWKFMNRSQYGSCVYSKAGIFLRSLENLVGKTQMYNFLKFYVGKYKYKHPTSNDFIETFNTFMEEDFSWAFDYYILGSGGLDHAVHSVQSTRISEEPVIYRNEVVVKRTAGYFPVELLITLEDGTEIKSYWKERETWKRFLSDDPSPIRQAVLDPKYKVPLDRNFLDNSKVRKPERSGIKRLAMKMGFLFQNIVSFFTF
jgi:hypothetical protein